MPSANPKTRSFPRRFYDLLFPPLVTTVTGVWIGGVAFLSLQPLRPDAAGRRYLHRPFHLVAFALTAVVLWRCLAFVPWKLRRPRSSAAGTALQAFLATVLLGGFLETAQHFIYGNPMEWWDLRDDAVAAAAALLLVWLARAARGAWRH